MNKFLVFCMSIIISIISPSQCFMMWATSDTVEWNKLKFDRQLENQDYSWLMPPLYKLLEDSSINREVFEWIEAGAEAGHVPMMYMFLRNYARALEFNIVIDNPEVWNKIGKFLLVLSVRLYQDEMYCKGSGNRRASDWGIIYTPLVYANLMSSKSDRDIFDVFRKKYVYWFGSTDLTSKIAFVDALDAATQWFDDHENVYDLDPAWAIYTYPSPGSKTYKIIFETPGQPMQQLVLADAKTTRKDLARVALEGFGELNNWLAFFAKQEAFKYKQKEETSTPPIPRGQQTNRNSTQPQEKFPTQSNYSGQNNSRDIQAQGSTPPRQQICKNSPGSQSGQSNSPGQQNLDSTGSADRVENSGNSPVQGAPLTSQGNESAGNSNVGGQDPTEMEINNNKEAK